VARQGWCCHNAEPDAQPAGEQERRAEPARHKALSAGRGQIVHNDRMEPGSEVQDDRDVNGEKRTGRVSAGVRIGCSSMPVEIFVQSRFHPAGGHPTAAPAAVALKTQSRIRYRIDQAVPMRR
jgi:hypothetical protein